MNLLIKAVMKIVRVFYINDDILILRFKRKMVNNLTPVYRTIKRCSIEDIENMRYRNKNVLIREILNGNNVYGVIINSEIVSLCCVAFSQHPIGEIKRIFKLPNKSLYIYHCFTYKNFRRKHLFRNLLLFLINEFKDQDKYIAVDKSNFISHHIIKSVGFQQVAQIQYKRILTKQCTLIKDNSSEIKDNLKEHY